MKKLLLLALVAVCFAGCSKDDELKQRSFNFRINANQWQWDDRGFYVGSVNDFRELTPNICDYGNVAVYVTLDNDGVQAALPYEFYRERIVEGEPERWSTQIDYEYNPGFINFFFTASDFEYFNDEPGGWTFRVVLTY